MFGNMKRPSQQMLANRLFNHYTLRRALRVMCRARRLMRAMCTYASYRFGYKLDNLQETDSPTETALTVPFSPGFAQSAIETLEWSNRSLFRSLEQALDQVAHSYPDPINFGPALGKLGLALTLNPLETARNANALWNRNLELLRESVVEAVFGIEKASPGTDSGDLQFRDPAWTDTPYYRCLRRIYLENANWIQQTAESADIGSVPERRKIALLTRILVESLSPENFVATNPAVLRATRVERGRNFLRGMQNFTRDVGISGWPPRVSKVNPKAFEVGKTVAATPGKVIWRNRLFELIQYDPQSRTVYEVPFLFVPPWINKYYILDLQPGKSMVRWLLRNGHSVFLISWINPDETLARAGLDTYFLEGAMAAIDRVSEETGQQRVNVAGYCIGGTLMGAALAHLAGSSRDRINSSTFFASQFDFSDAGDLMALTDERTIKQLSEKMRAKGYLPSGSMAGSFDMLRSADLFWHFIVQNYLLGVEPGEFDLLFWNADSTRMPARLHEEYLRGFYLENRLARSALRLDGRMLNLSDIRVPTYHVAAREDHIAPPESVYRGMRLMGGEKRFVLADSGHIAGIMNPPSTRKHAFRADGTDEAASLKDWETGAAERAGSWWTDWKRWLAGLSGDRTPPRQPGATLGVLADAPGNYVRIRYDD